MEVEVKEDEESTEEVQNEVLQPSMAITARSCSYMSYALVLTACTSACGSCLRVFPQTMAC